MVVGEVPDGSGTVQDALRQRGRFKGQQSATWVSVKSLA